MAFPAHWQAVWISPVKPAADAEPAAPAARLPAGERPTHLLRRTFTVPGGVTGATLFATAHGIYEAHLDGVRVGDQELTPGFTEYAKRLQVQTYDVAELLPAAGATAALTFEVSDGWYRGKVGILRSTEQWGDTTGIVAELHLTGPDGIVATIASDAAWEATPTRHLADPIDGESVDLRDDPLEGTGDWRPVLVGPPPGDELCEPLAPPVRRIETLSPVAVDQRADRCIVDFGQNLVGWVRLRDLGARGSELVLTHGEELGPDGDVTQVNLVANIPMMPEPLPAGQVDHVIADGDPATVFEPRHTTRGFRYLRIEGLDHSLDPAAIEAVVVHTDLRRTGTFTCSDPDLNRLHEAAVWSFRGNAVDVPTDCPVRERAAWTGDWQIFFPTAAYLFDVSGFDRKWLADVAATQWDDGVIPNQAPMPRGEGPGTPVGFMNGSAGWGDACVIVPWQHYLAYGDAEVLRDMWPTMTRWMDWVTAQAAGARHPTREAAHPEPRSHDRYLWDTGWHFGEWLEPGGFDFPAHLAADKGVVATAFFAHSAALMAASARVLGRDADERAYAALAGHVRDAWRLEFLDETGRVSPASQANCVRALTFGLVSGTERTPVAEQLVELVHAAGDHLGTGFLATPDLLPALADAGSGDLAYTVLLQRDYPSWLGMLDQGATTMWERWEGWTDDGYPHESHNHYSKGAVISFLHRYVAGLRPAPGSVAWDSFVVAPVLGGGLTSAATTFDSPHGLISTSWTLTDAEFILEVEIPLGSHCTVRMPSGTEYTPAPGTHVFAEPA